MLKYLRIFTITGFIFLLQISNALGVNMVNIYLITDNSYLGDKNSILGVAEETKKLFNEHKYKVHILEHNLHDLPGIKNGIAISKNPIILITSGKYGINVINNLKAEPTIHDKIVAIHLSHQILHSKDADHLKLINNKDNTHGADIIVLPEHAIENDFKEKFEGSNTKLFTTIGISHNLNVKNIENAFTKNKSVLPKANSYLAVFLPGDAPDSKGQISYYTPNDAEKYAKFISKYAIKNNYRVLVTNGPRTGKFDPITGKENHYHSNKAIIDPVTLKFIDVLNRTNTPYKLFDYQAGEKNYKDTILGAILQTPQSKIFLPGESSSTISECLDLIPAEKIIIYVNNAMSKNHKIQVESEFKRGRASILDSEMKILDPDSFNKDTVTSSKIVANEIYNFWQKYVKAKNHTSK